MPLPLPIIVQQKWDLMNVTILLKVLYVSNIVRYCSRNN